MSIKSKFLEKVSKLIFLEFKKESIFDIFGIEVEENIFLPLRPLRVMDKIKEGEQFEKIPISFFIEGMFFVLGGDENFKLNNIYLNLLGAKKNEAVDYMRDIIFDEVKKEAYEDAYIMLKGVIHIDSSEENYEKLIMLLENLRSKNKDYEEEELAVLCEADKIDGYYKPFLYRAINYYHNNNYQDAFANLTTYIDKSKDDSAEIIELKNSILNIRNYENGKALVYEKPEEALKLLIPLLKEFSDDAVLNFNIALAYRKLGIYEKAIYYLNDAIAIDSALVEVINELGVNYASLNDFESAIKYLRKAFEATKSIEICTNLIMCYLNKGDIKNARLHYDIAIKINSKDEIVLELNNILNNLENN